MEKSIMVNIKKKVLFIAPKFYNYHIQIINTLEKQGYDVIYYPEMEHTLLYRLSNKLSQKLKIYLEAKYLNFILSRTRKDEYDVFFVIRGGYFSIDWLERLRSTLPKAKFLMYQWDSAKQNNYLPFVHQFDSVKTFDMFDAKEYDLEYLPLFYTQEYKDLRVEKKEKKYDLVFFGAYHSDRLEVVKQIEKLFKKHGLCFKYHLFITKLALMRLVLTRVISFKDLHYFKTHSVPSSEIIETYKEATAVLDIELSIQNGLTIRTFETLGAGLSLVTTNKNIMNESFYNSDTIMYIDRKNIKMDLEFFKDNKNVNNDFEEFYIESWLNKIFA